MRHCITQILKRMKKHYSFIVALLLTSAIPDMHAEMEFVDLGLPSGTLWANMNVGASSEEEGGLFLSWGETEAKTDYSWATYKWCDGTQSIMTKYVVDEQYGQVDGKTVLDPEDDAAATGENIGSPTIEEFNELLDKNNCTWTLETINDRKGARVTGPNGNSIFLPACGFMTGTRLSTNNTAGCFWTNTLTTTQARYYYNAHVVRVGISRTSISIDARDHNGAGFVPRNYGYNIRPVKHSTGSSGIDNIADDNATPVKYYSITGVETATPSKGLNIAICSDGSIRKIIVK